MYLKIIFVPLSFSVIALTSLCTSANAKANYFSCEIISNVPTTVANMASGKKVSVIRWVSNTFSNSGWSPSARCNKVSQRFTELNQKGTLRYLTTGRVNGQNVICAAIRKGDRCNDLLFTLKPGQNPTATLHRLFNVQRKANAGPLNETGDRGYVNVNTLLGYEINDRPSLPSMSTGDKLNEW